MNLNRGAEQRGASYATVCRLCETGRLLVLPWKAGNRVATSRAARGIAAVIGETP